VTIVEVVQMTIGQIVDVVVVADGRMAAAGLVQMGVFGMDGAV
jgi:hypothetical protein